MKYDKTGVQLLARVFHDLVAGKTDPHEQKILKLIQQAVERRLTDTDGNVYKLARTALEMAERITALEDCVDELVAQQGQIKEVPEWVH